MDENDIESTVSTDISIDFENWDDVPMTRSTKRIENKLLKLCGLYEKKIRKIKVDKSISIGLTRKKLYKINKYKMNSEKMPKFSTNFSHVEKYEKEIASDNCRNWKKYVSKESPYYKKFQDIDAH